MRSQIQSFSIYAFAIFFNAAVSFVIFSLLTHYLNEVDYGIINLYNSSLIFLSPFIAIGIQYALGVDYFKLDEKAYRQYFTNAIAIPIIASILFTILFIFFRNLIQNFTSTTLFFTLTIPFACLLTILTDILLNLFRNKEKHFLFVNFSIFKNIIEVGLTILFVIFLGYNWEGRLISFLTTLVIIFLIIIYFIKRWRLFTGYFDKEAAGVIFKNGLPFIPERFAIFVLGYSDRFFINYFESTADVGFFSAGTQVALIVYLVILALNNTFYPEIFKSLSRAQPDYVKLRKATLIFIGISVFVTAGVIVCIPIIFKFFIGSIFQKSQVYAIFLTIGMFFWAIYNVFLPYLLNLKKNRLIMTISIFGMIISVVFNYFNIKYLGTMGAAFTSIAVYFFMAAVTVYFVHKYYGIGKIFNAKTSIPAENSSDVLC